MKILNTGISGITGFSQGPAWTNPSDQKSFQSVFNNLMQEVKDTQQKADDLTLKFMAGSVDDMHQVAFAMEQAKLTLQMSVQLRNKIIDVYQEVMRMQI